MCLWLRKPEAYKGMMRSDGHLRLPVLGVAHPKVADNNMRILHTIYRGPNMFGPLQNL